MSLAHCASLSTQHVYGRRAFPVAGPTVWSTLHQINSEIQRVMLTASNSSLKQSRSVSTSVTGALEIIF